MNRIENFFFYDPSNPQQREIDDKVRTVANRLLKQNVITSRRGIAKYIAQHIDDHYPTGVPNVLCIYAIDTIRKTTEVVHHSLREKSLQATLF